MCTPISWCVSKGPKKVPESELGGGGFKNPPTRRSLRGSQMCDGLRLHRKGKNGGVRWRRLLKRKRTQGAGRERIAEGGRQLVWSIQVDWRQPRSRPSDQGEKGKSNYGVLGVTRRELWLWLRRQATSAEGSPKRRSTSSKTRALGTIKCIQPVILKPALTCCGHA
jgi:hypothetical protein